MYQTEMMMLPFLHVVLEIIDSNFLMHPLLFCFILGVVGKRRRHN